MSLISCTRNLRNKDMRKEWNEKREQIFLNRQIAVKKGRMGNHEKEERIINDIKRK